MRDQPDLATWRATAEYLRQLLLKPGRYRDEWRQYVARPREGVINQLAIAEVIVRREQSKSGRLGKGPVASYQLKDVVAGALSGRQLGRDSLALIIDAFQFADHETDRLWRLWEGTSKIAVLSGSHAVPPHAEQSVDRVVGPRRHVTVSLHDHVYVGDDGRIDRARAIQVIEATEQDVDRIPFLCDTNVLTLEVGQGGEELSGTVEEIGKGIFFTEIILARSLGLGETATLEYYITYRYPGDFENQEECEFRRAVIRQVENLDMRVEFSGERVPRHIWWSRWDGVEGHVISEELVSLDREFSAQRYVRSIEKTVCGFHWAWD